MKKYFYSLLFILGFTGIHAQKTAFEKSNGKETSTYFEAIQFYKSLAQESHKIKIETKGQTDAGYPLHLVMISTDQEFDPVVWHKKQKVLLLINNGIHPGEPDGIDASMMLTRDIVLKKIILPDNVVLAIIPVYNIGGSLNRNSFSRVNQNGPESYGFRGNAQNLDLNRDFIKCDSRNARSFIEIFHYLNPDILIDNHVSDGADYQHVMTLITTQYNKLGGELGKWLRSKFNPLISQGMLEKGWDLVPYVNVEDKDPSQGFSQFYDQPRYSSGYAALFNTLSFMPETHMLKPYSQRVKSTYDLMVTMIQQAGLNANTLITLRKNAIENSINQKKFPLTWKLDTSKSSEITFKGYEAVMKKSNATGFPILFYDHNKPFTRQVKYYDIFTPSNLASAPDAYIIPQGWWAVIDLLFLNHVSFTRLTHDTLIKVTAYSINNYNSFPKPYEKHHKNYEVTIGKTSIPTQFLKGDYLIKLNQPANRYLVETLEPDGDDGFFAWNFFDSILQQKEGYSEYRWDSLATKVLERSPSLQKILEEKKDSDSNFRNNSAAQLDFIYKNSPYYEHAHLRYPVYRIDKGL